MLRWLDEKWKCDIQVKTKILEYKTEQRMNEWMNEWKNDVFIYSWIKLHKKLLKWKIKTVLKRS